MSSPLPSHSPALDSAHGAQAGALRYVPAFSAALAVADGS